MSKETGARPTRIGAVAYDPKVVTIWEGFKAYFDKHGLDTDFVLYSNYDAQVQANLNGEIDIAWNSPLAWVKSQLLTGGRCRALAMRDSDRDLTTKIIVRKQSPFATLADLNGNTVAVGASDSPQATLIPLNMIAAAGVIPGTDCRVALPRCHGGQAWRSRGRRTRCRQSVGDGTCRRRLYARRQLFGVHQRRDAGSRDDARACLDTAV